MTKWNWNIELSKIEKKGDNNMDGVETNNNIELKTEHKTEKKDVDKVEKKEEEFPEEAKKLFGIK